MRTILPRLLLLSLLLALSAVGGSANEPARSEDGKYFGAAGDPTYRIEADGIVDWYTYSGFRRYHSECHVCHGPDGLGGSFAPGLVQPMKTMSYNDFLSTVANGRQNVNTSTQSKMPAFGDNKNVMCFIDDLYIYLKPEPTAPWGVIDRRSGHPNPRRRKPRKRPASDA